MSKRQGTFYAPQALFLYGTKAADGTPHFGLFSWFGYAWVENKPGVMVCIGEEKMTKDHIRANGVFSANLVTEALLPLADYYGNTPGRAVPDKMKLLPTVVPGQVLDVPTVAESPLTLELEVAQTVEQEAGSTVLICRIRNTLVEEALLDQSLPLPKRLTQSGVVLSPSEESYMTIDGRFLGHWGEPMKQLNQP